MTDLFEIHGVCGITEKYGLSSSPDRSVMTMSLANCYDALSPMTSGVRTFSQTQIHNLVSIVIKNLLAHEDMSAADYNKLQGLATILEASTQDVDLLNAINQITTAKNHTTFTNATSTCTTAADCDDSNVCTTDACTNGACTHPANTAACNTHIATGFYCLEGTCTCYIGTRYEPSAYSCCNSYSDCSHSPFIYSCTNHTCVENSACATGQCPDGQYCSSLHICASGY